MSDARDSALAGRPPEAPHNVMEIRTVQAPAIKVLTEALKELLTDTVLEVDATGVRIVAMDVSHVVLVHLKLAADKFEHFECPEPLQLGVNMLNLYKIIKTIGNTDTLTLYVEDGDVNHLGIRVDNPEKNSRTNYKLNLLDLDGSKISVQPSQFSSVITLMSADVQKIFRDLSQISELAEIKRIGNDLIFKSHKGDFCSQETVLSDATVRENPEADEDIRAEDAGDIIQGLFSLKYLAMFTRCSALSSTVDILLKNDFPIIFIYSVSSLGSLKLCLATSTE